MIIKTHFLYKQFQKTDSYTIKTKYKKSSTKIILDLHNGMLNTRELPNTSYLLNKSLPSIFQSTCFNENNYPFKKEVKDTELGHLFEHILIENLCLIKVAKGYDDVEYSGITKWNWLVYPKGTFLITVNSGLKDRELFEEAMFKSTNLFDAILNSNVPDDYVNTIPDTLNNIIPIPNEPFLLPLQPL